MLPKAFHYFTLTLLVAAAFQTVPPVEDLSAETKSAHTLQVPKAAGDQLHNFYMRYYAGLALAGGFGKCQAEPARRMLIRATILQGMGLTPRQWQLRIAAQPKLHQRIGSEYRRRFCEAPPVFQLAMTTFQSILKRWIDLMQEQPVNQRCGLQGQRLLIQAAAEFKVSKEELLSGDGAKEKEMQSLFIDALAKLCPEEAQQLQENQGADQ